MQKRFRELSNVFAVAMVTVLMLTSSVVPAHAATETVPMTTVEEVKENQQVQLLLSNPEDVLIDNGVAHEERQSRPMRVLLINDDGYDSEGIQMLFDALKAEGYDVWMVAPIQNQSGVGTSITNKPGQVHELVDHGDQKYAFEGTPTDAFKVAVNVLMADAKPDLVISGVNDGPNVGEAQFNSGTVGGAARAIRHGYPSIAASIGVPDDKATLEEYLAPAVDFVVDIVGELNDEWKNGDMIMPMGTGISINYPTVAPEEVQGIKYIRNEAFYTAFQIYEEDENGDIVETMDMGTLMGQIQNPNVETDISELFRGWVTISTIDADWNADQEKEDYMKKVLEDIQAVD